MGLTQVPFKLLLLPWILESVELCEPFKNEVSISPQSSDSPKSKPPWLSNSNVLEAHLPCIGALGWGDHCGAQTTHSLGRIILPFVGRLLGDISLDYIASLPLPSILLWFVLYIFTCRRSFPLVFMLFSLIAGL